MKLVGDCAYEVLLMAATASTTGTTAVRAAGPCVIVIFGASGDLTRRKLIPALYNLALDGLLPPQVAVIGLATGDFDSDGFRRHLRADLAQFSLRPVDEKIWSSLACRIHYVRGAFDDAQAFRNLASKIADVATDSDSPLNLCHYLAVSPKYFGTIVRQLAAIGLAQEKNGQWRRVVVEKPF